MTQSEHQPFQEALLSQDVKSLALLKKETYSSYFLRDMLELVIDKHLLTSFETCQELWQRRLDNDQEDESLTEDETVLDGGLAYACYGPESPKNQDMIDLLLANGARPNVLKGQAVRYAIEEGRWQVVEKLLTHNADMTRLPLVEVSKKLNRNMWERLLPYFPVQRHPEHTLVHMIENKHPWLPEALEHLSTSAAAVNLRLDHYYSYHHRSIYASLMRIITKATFDQHAKHNTQPTAWDELMYGVAYHEHALVARHINQELGQLHQSMLLGWASELGDTRMVEVLLPHSNPKDDNSGAFRNAVLANHMDTALVLLPHSDPSANGCVALMNAVKNDNEELAKILAAHTGLEEVFGHYKKIEKIPLLGTFQSFRARSDATRKRLQAWVDKWELEKEVAVAQKAPTPRIL